jgi:hypothetical protein
VPKVHNKPIKRPRKGSNKESKRLPKCALVWRTGLSRAPQDNVRCTREPDSELATFGNSGSRSAIIHRTVRCSTRLSGVAPDCPVHQRSNGYTAPTVVCNGIVKRYSARLRARSQSRRQKAHRTVNSDCPVHHRTVRWPSCQKLLRPEPNARVTWLAHRTVSGDAPDCPVRHATTPSPTTILVVGVINTPNHPPFIASKFSAFKHHTRVITFNTRHKQRDQILSHVRNHTNQISD